MAYVVMKWWTRRRSPGELRRYPPSLRSIPILGSLPFLPLFEKMNTEFMAMTEQLGNVFAFYIGNR